MSPKILAAGVLLLAWPPGVGTSSPDVATRPDCAPAASRVLLKADKLEVYRAGSYRTPSIVCDRVTGEKYFELDGPDDLNYVFPPPAMNAWGRTLTVANLTDYAEPGLDMFGFHTSVAAYRLGTDHPRIAGAFPPDWSQPQKVASALFVEPDTLVWTACGMRDPGTPHPDRAILRRNLRVGRGGTCRRPGRLTWVFVHRKGEYRARLIDRGRNLDPLSLRLNGLIVSWEKNGTTRRYSVAPGRFG